MATFELNGDSLNQPPKSTVPTASKGRFEKDSAENVSSSEYSQCVDSASQNQGSQRIRSESIIALKVYDSCRQQECLTGEELGPARSAECQCLLDRTYHEGEIIDPPDCVASVTVDRLRIKKIIITDKCANPFKNGFWDIDIKYVFEYRIIFRKADVEEIGCLKAHSIFNKKVTLFGSMGSNIVISTDLLSDRYDESPSLSYDPFVLVEAKAVALSSKLRYSRNRNLRPDEFSPVPNEVFVTIGLFSIIKLYRIVQLSVESRGFTIPAECSEYMPVNACDYFENMPFPMDIFAPPQRAEFESGISGDIPKITSADEALQSS